MVRTIRDDRPASPDTAESEPGMRKVLYIMSQFRDQDIDWIIGAGSKQTVPIGTVLIRQGEAIHTLYIVLRGRFVVSTDSGVTIAELGSGEIFGELSFLDSRPPNASVTALEKSVVLVLGVKRLRAKLRTDNGFAARFYRALGILLADRLRDTVGQLAYGEGRLDENVEAQGELSPELLDGLNLAAARFDRILQNTLGSK